MSNIGLNKSLKPRHMIMMALGGCIGTGLFIGSGAVINQAGPGGAVLAYVLISVIVYFLMQSLGEMATLRPTTGSFNEYASEYVSEAFGFAAGWNYWFNWAITIAVELSSASLCMLYWFPHSSFLEWAILFFALILLLNLFSVQVLGESEFWLSTIKVICVIVFIIFGVLLFIGILNNTRGNAMSIDKGHYFNGGLLSFISVFLVAAFSFQGTELVGITAGEAKDPVKTVPKAINTVFWRLMFFCVFTVIVMSLIIPYNSPYLLNSDITKVVYSPFTLVFEMTGIPFAASIINFIILIAVLSACNASLYTSSRTLWYLAKVKKAPKIFKHVAPNSVPVFALVISAIIGMASFLASKFGLGAVYLWLINISSLCGFMAWFVISVSHYRFRKSLLSQGYKPSQLPFQAKFFPLNPILPSIFVILIILGQGMSMFQDGFNLIVFLTTYIGVLVFFLLWFMYRLVANDTKVDLKKCNFDDANFIK